MKRRQFIKKAGLVGGASFYGSHVYANKFPIKVNMVTTWPKNYPGVGSGANQLAKNIEELSQGRLKIKVFGAGELVPALGVFDAVQQGTAQMGHGVSYYWQGKVSAAPFFSSVPFGLNAQEMNGWLAYGGGKELWEEAYKPFGVRPFAAGNTGMQMGGWFNKEIRSVADLKGLKVRMPGLGAKVLSNLGSAVVTLSGGEVFQALKNGTIDAAEWIGPYNDLATGLHKAAKFYYWPGWHEPGSNLEFIINEKFFSGLPKDLQKVVEICCGWSSQQILSEYTARNPDGLRTLVQKNKVKLKSFPKSVLKVLSKTSNEVVAEMAKQSPLGQKVFTSYRSFQKKSQSWYKISEGSYGETRQII